MYGVWSDVGVQDPLILKEKLFIVALNYILIENMECTLSRSQVLTLTETIEL